MQRREVYATTDPRITVRMFGSWNFDSLDEHTPNLARTGYSRGVPMGGDLGPVQLGRAPTLLVGALRDQEGPNIDRIQIIKGSRDVDGELHEKIYNVAMSGDRLVRPNGSVMPVENSVKVDDSNWENSIGTAQLQGRWRDPDFNVHEHAFYYLRVLDIPAPR
jgi:hypothetical protein